MTGTQVDGRKSSSSNYYRQFTLVNLTSRSIDSFSSLALFPEISTCNVNILKVGALFSIVYTLSVVAFYSRHRLGETRHSYDLFQTQKCAI